MIYKQRKIKIAIVTNIITTYREGFYDILFSNDNIDLTVYCQSNIPGTNFISIHSKYGERIKIVNFFSLKNDKLCWQKLPFKEIYQNYDVIFMNGNPRIISDLFFSTFLKIMNKNIIHWTMVRSFRANKYTEYLRLRWSKIFKNIFVYTDDEVDYLVKNNFNNKNIIGMNNGLDQKKIDLTIDKWNDDKLEQWQIDNNLQDKIVIITSARLIRKNKFDQLIEALVEVKIKYPNILLCFIGDGEERNELLSLTRSLSLENNIKFLGSIYEENLIAPWFLTSKILIHTGAIGLTLMHAFGYGLPIITHSTKKHHGPEFAAFKENINGFSYKEDDVGDLSNIIISKLNDENLELISKNAKYTAQNEYNIDIMVERFIKIVELTLDKK